MTCSADRRDEARDAAARLRAVPTVADVDVLAPAESRHGRWTLEIVVDGVEVRSVVVLAIGQQSLDIQPPVESKAGRTIVVATL